MSLWVCLMVEVCGNWGAPDKLGRDPTLNHSLSNCVCVCVGGEIVCVWGGDRVCVCGVCGEGGEIVNVKVSNNCA